MLAWEFGKLLHLPALKRSDSTAHLLGMWSPTEALHAAPATQSMVHVRVTDAEWSLLVVLSRFSAGLVYPSVWPCNSFGNSRVIKCPSVMLSHKAQF